MRVSLWSRGCPMTFSDALSVISATSTYGVALHFELMLPGGKLENGEMSFEAAVREVRLE